TQQRHKCFLKTTKPEGKRINRPRKQNVRNAIRTLSGAVNQQQHHTYSLTTQLNHRAEQRD
ncbi:hypothetical protein ACNJ0W_005515, partial [Escherichia coli]